MSQQQQQRQQHHQYQQEYVSASDQREAPQTVDTSANNDNSTARHSSCSNTNRTGTASVRQRTALQERSANTAGTAAATQSSADTYNNRSNSRLNVDRVARHKQSQHR
jgi:hypothetical protein